MFNYNEKTVTNIQFKMLELFRTIKADKTVKQDAGNVVSVNLVNILSPDRTYLEESDLVKEIYIFEINLNSNKIPEKFLDALNKSINFQTLFKLKYAEKEKHIISIKTFEDEKIKVLKVFETDWGQKTKQEFPITTKLDFVFKEMIKYITTISFKQDETFSEYIERFEKITKLQVEIEKQTKIMNAEKQPNFRMALNDKIKQMKKELKELEWYGI